MASIVSTSSFVAHSSCSIVYFGLEDNSGWAKRGVYCSASTLYWDPSCAPSTPLSQPNCPDGYPVKWTSSSATACCPSGYSYSVSQYKSIERPVCDSVAVRVESVTNCVTSSAPSIRDWAGRYQAPVIRLGSWPVTSSPVQTGAFVSTPTLKQSPTAGQPQNTGGSQHASNKHMKKSALIGLIIGAIVALAILVVAGFCLLRHKRRRTLLEETHPECLSITPVPYLDAKSELQGTSVVKPGEIRTFDPKKNPPSSPPIHANELAGGAAVSENLRHEINEHASVPQDYPFQLHNQTTEPTIVEADSVFLPSPSQSQYVEMTGPQLPETFVSQTSQQPPPADRIAQLEASQRDLEVKMMRLRHLTALEEEHARTQAELEQLRSL
ncbi:hypothetical protein EK21DRAFT_86554 [Setomelanomma holmii]|uniref:Uncharacterized protein n=1 Tax=Setomelanomma holmii TaxID=210430 RepID=A0A9P4LRU0_9PLEO|nr:hypothetical protein EK21DRAFT_86554 [Setomelanomma holmii]